MDEDGFTLGDEAVVSGSGQVVEVFEPYAVGKASPGGQQEVVVVTGGGFEADFEFDDDQEYAGVFEGFVIVAVEAEQFSSAHFEIDGVSAVVDGILAINLAIADLDGDPAGGDGAGSGLVFHGGGSGWMS